MLSILLPAMLPDVSNTITKFKGLRAVCQLLCNACRVWAD